MVIRLLYAHQRGSLQEPKCCRSLHLRLPFASWPCLLLLCKRICAPEKSQSLVEQVLTKGPLLLQTAVYRVLIALQELAPWWGNTAGHIVAVCPRSIWGSVQGST